MRTRMQIVDPRGPPEPTPKVTPDHWLTVKNTIIGGVMSLLTAVAGIAGSHWGGATKSDIQEIKKDIAAQALDNAIAHSAIWGQMSTLQQRAFTVDPSPKPAPKRPRKIKGTPVEPTDQAP